jgi:ribosome maturation protein Sdo1
MSKGTTITIRLNQELKEQFELAVKDELVRAVRNDEEFNHITTSEILRSFIKAYTGGKLQ